MIAYSFTAFGTCKQEGVYHTGTDLEHCHYMDKTGRYCLEAEEKELFYY